jgi:hypothetical protein
MSNTIQIKRSTTAGAVPTAGQLAQGELAVNLADEALYTKDASNAVVKLNAPSIDDKNTGATKHVTIASGGNVGIGTSSPDSQLTISRGGLTSAYSIKTIRGGRNDQGIFTDGAGIALRGVDTTNGATAVFVMGDNVDSNNYNRIQFNTYGSERARIDSSGNLLVGTTDSSLTASPGIKFRPSASNADMGIVQNTASNLGAYHLYNTNGTNNGYRFYVTTNGGISNFSGNNVNLSDERTKKNIEVAGGYLDKICAIPVKLFNYKDEVEGEQRTLGVIAQDVEAVAPEFVSNDGWEGAAHEDGGPLKTVYTTDMMFGLMKAIQEQQAIITALTARVVALEKV